MAVANAFCSSGSVLGVEPLGGGNVNHTFLLRTTEGTRVLQRINTSVFRQPEGLMANLRAVARHARSKLSDASRCHPLLQQRRWELPEPVGELHRCEQGAPWRCITFVDNSSSVDCVADPQQAQELGLGLGLFHHLISDLPAESLTDTLEGFHITPLYLDAYKQALVRTQQIPSEEANRCIAFIRERESITTVLEHAKARGTLPLRPIHGDPKINNVMFDRSSGAAVALVDLDTVKPGLVHYDIGDCLRSCCNPAGEECESLDAVQFDLNLASAVLRGYLSVARSFLAPAELALIPDAVRLISFELGLRFFTDYLQGNTYFQVQRPEQNLQRALVQFQLTASIESQMDALRELVEQIALERQDRSFCA